MNVPFVIAAALALVAAAIHGGAGEALVVSKLQTSVLAPTRFGGPAFTKLMIRATWHIATLAFLISGASLAVCAPVASSDACAGIGRMTAISYASFGALAVGLAMKGGVGQALRALRRHPAPLVFVAVAVLAWRGSLG